MLTNNLFIPSGWTGLIRFNHSNAIRTYRVSHYQQGNFSVVYHLLSDQCVGTQTPMEWTGTGPPKDTPVCGFSGNSCKSDGEDTQNKKSVKLSNKITAHSSKKLDPDWSIGDMMKTNRGILSHARRCK